MSEMIERVADKIRELQKTDFADPWFIARVAIEAMREPTRAQYDALCATHKLWRELDSKTVWQTYIDAALRDAETVDPVALAKSPE